MTQRYAVLFVVCAVVGAAVGLPAVAAQETATPTETNDSDAGFGTQLTAFTQASSAAANDSVENGMWRAGFEQSNASERARLVTDRTDGLEARLERLRAENETVQQQYENGTIAEQAYVARQSRLNARIDALRTAVNDTDAAAAEAGVNDSRLERLKQNASRLSGPDVAGIARGLGGGPNELPPQAADRGPPNNRTADRGPSADAGNETAGGGPPATDSDRRDGQGQGNGPTSENTERADGDNPGTGPQNAGNGDRGNGGQRGN